MDPKVKTGIGAAQKGLKAVKVGKKALDMKKKLPGEKKKAMLKAAEKAAKKAGKLIRNTSMRARTGICCAMKLPTADRFLLTAMLFLTGKTSPSTRQRKQEKNSLKSVLFFSSSISFLSTMFLTM